MVIPEKKTYQQYSLEKCIWLKENYLEILANIKEENLEYLFNIELKLSIVLANMEKDGLKIDLTKIDELEKIFTKKDFFNSIFNSFFLPIYSFVYLYPKAYFNKQS